MSLVSTNCPAVSLPRPTITKYYLSYYLNLQNRV